MNRRQLVAAVVAGGVAGCLGDDTTSDDTLTTSDDTLTTSSDTGTGTTRTETPGSPTTDHGDGEQTGTPGEQTETPSDGETATDEPTASDEGTETGTETETATATPTEPRLQAVAVFGPVESASGEPRIGAITIVIKRALGVEPVDLRQLTATVSLPSGEYELTDVRVGGPATASTVSVVAGRDDNDSLPVIDEPRDRVELGFQLGDDGFARRLRPGESGNVRLDTPGAPPLEVPVTVPSELDGDAVRLDGE